MGMTKTALTKSLHGQLNNCELSPPQRVSVLQTDFTGLGKKQKRKTPWVK
jgi:hypothetical protein